MDAVLDTSTPAGQYISSQPEIGHWVMGRLGSSFFAERNTAIGLLRDGQIVVGVAFENWNRRSIMAHMVAEGRLTRLFIGAIFDYAYNVCGVDKVICPVDQTNLRSMKLLRHMGFAEEARLRDCSPQGDIVLFTLAKADCRFLAGRFGYRQVNTPSPSGA